MYSYRVIDVQLLENANLPRDVPVDCLGQQTCKCRYFIHFYGPEHKFITFWVNLRVIGFPLKNCQVLLINIEENLS